MYSGSQVLDNTRQFLFSSIVCIWMTPAHPKDVNITFSDNTGTLEMFQYSPIHGMFQYLELGSTLFPPKICYGKKAFSNRC